MHTGNMPLPPAPKLSLSDSDRKHLLEISRHRSTPRGIALRIDILLGAAEGIANHLLARNLYTSLPTVLLWRRRFDSGGLVLLCYKQEAPQKGQLDSCRSRTRAMVCRRVAIDQGLCRSMRIGRAPREESRRCFGTG